MTDAVTFSPSIHPICLPNSAMLNPDHLLHRSTSVVGYGANFIKDGKATLQEARFEIFPSSTCNTTYATSSYLNRLKITRSLPDLFQEDLICAGDPYSDDGVCRGDSGGPLVIFTTNVNGFSHVQIGVTHGAVANCYGNAFPGIFVRLDDVDVLEFIHNATRTVILKGMKDYFMAEIFF